MDRATQLRIFHRDVSGSLDLGTGDGDATLAVGKAGHTIYIQAVQAYIQTDAAQSLSFEDTAGTPKVVCVVPTSPGANTPWRFEFGPIGVPLTEGEDFVLDVSAAGIGAHIEWYGYIKQTSTVTAASLASAT